MGWIPKAYAVPGDSKMLQSQQDTGKSLHELIVAAGKVGYSREENPGKLQGLVALSSSGFSVGMDIRVISAPPSHQGEDDLLALRGLQEAQVGWGVAEGTGGGTYLGVQVLLWVGTSDGVHRGLVRVGRRRVGRRGVVTLGRWHLVGSPRSVPCQRQEGSQSGPGMAAQGCQEGWDKPSHEQMWAPRTVWDAQAQPSQNTQIYLIYSLHQCSAVREGQDFQSNIPHHPPSSETV